MIVFAKKVLYKLLSQKAYLRTLHRSFYLLYSLGFLKNDRRFKYHYLVKELIESNNTVVDVGANLGYFSKTFARLTRDGKLISIEPIKPFFDTLSYFLKKYKHAQIFNYALGNQKGMVTMVMPETNGMMRTGLPHIAESEDDRKAHKSLEVQIVQGSELLGHLERIDYIKCDIEGYELVVFEELKKLIEHHKPMIQIEIGKENEVAMLNYFDDLDYVQFGVANFKIVQEKQGQQQEQGDYLFVHRIKLTEFENKMRKSGRLLKN